MTKLMLVIFLCYHWFGCVWYLIARVKDFNDDTWVSAPTTHTSLCSLMRNLQFPIRSWRTSLLHFDASVAAVCILSRQQSAAKEGGGLTEKCLITVLPQVTRITNSIFTFYDPLTSDLISTYLVILFRGGNGMTNFGLDPERPNNPAEVVWSMVTIVFQIFLSAYVLGACPSKAL